MKALQRTLAVLACHMLIVQGARHAYVLWLEPGDSALDAYDRPLKDEIAGAQSLDELVAQYDPVRREVERLKAERRAADREATLLLLSLSIGFTGAFGDEKGEAR